MSIFEHLLEKAKCLDPDGKVEVHNVIDDEINRLRVEILDKKVIMTFGDPHADLNPKNIQEDIAYFETRIKVLQRLNEKAQALPTCK